MDCTITAKTLGNVSSKEQEQIDTFVSSLSTSDKLTIMSNPKFSTARALNAQGVTSNGSPVELAKVETADGIVITDMNGNKVDSIEVDGQVKSTDEITKLYSDMAFVSKEGEEWEQLAVDVYNDPEKIIQLGEDLDKLDYQTLDADYKNELMQMLKDSAEYFKKALPAITVHINKAVNQRTSGVLRVLSQDKAAIDLRLGTSGKSALETYAHEVYHAATEYALESGDPELAGVRRRILQIREEIIKGTTVQQMVKYYKDYPNPHKEATQLLDQISSGKQSIHEFVVLAKTHKPLRDMLTSMKTNKDEIEHPNMASRLAYWVKKALDVVFMRVVVKEPKTENALEAMAWLTMQVMVANDRGLTAKKKGLIAELFGSLTRTDSKIAEWLEGNKQKLVSKVGTVKPPKPGTWGAVSWLAKYGGLALIDANTRKMWSLTAATMNMRQDGIMQNLGRDLFGIGDKVADLVERMGLQSQRIDQQRQIAHQTGTLTLRKAFDKQLTPKEMDVLWVLQETDAVVLQNRDDFHELMGVTTRDKAIAKAISEIENTLGKAVGKERTNYYKWQAEGLANYMKTGKGSIAQLLNADAIAHMINTENPIAKVEQGLISAIDQLVSLYALRDVEQDRVIALDRLLTESQNGVGLVLAHLAVIKQDSIKRLFDNGRDMFRYTKGYVKELYPDELETVSAPVSEEENLRKQGFKLVKHHELNGLVTSTVPMAYYVNTLPVKPRLHKVGFRYTNNSMRGQSLRDMYYKQNDELAAIMAKKDTLAINDKVKALMSQVMQTGKGTLSKEETALLPLVSRDGEVVEFRFVMGKEDKKEYLNMSVDLLDVLGATQGAIADKAATPEHNRVLLDILIKDMKENYVDGSVVGRNNEQYTVVGPNTTDERLKELWLLLPDQVRSIVPEGMAIRNDLLLDTLGFRELSVGNIKLLSRVAPEVKRVLQVAEMVWKEVIKMVKTSILLKIPMVLVANVYSNFMYSVMNGYMPTTVAKYQLQAVRELNEYIKDMRRGIELGVKVKAGIATEVEIREHASLESKLQGSAIKDLVDEGFYTQMLEELEAGGDTSRATKYINSKLEGAPKLVRNGLDWLYLAETTPVYQFMNTATQYSDFVARYAHYQLMRKDGVDKEKAITHVRNAFVNYNKANNPKIEYANQMGLVMFTKYFTRIQKVITELFKGHPITATMVLLGEHYLLGDLSVVSDSSVLVKDLGNLFYNPIGELLQVATPAGAVLAKEILL